MRRDFYAMDIDRERRCFNYRSFEHMAHYYRNWGIVGEERRIEFGNNINIDNLKEKGDKNLNWVS